jgi:hypothetical protein
MLVGASHLPSQQQDGRRGLAKGGTNRRRGSLGPPARRKSIPVPPLRQSTQKASVTLVWAAPPPAKGRMGQAVRG